MNRGSLLVGGVVFAASAGLADVFWQSRTPLGPGVPGEVAALATLTFGAILALFVAAGGATTRP